ncbi:hypothetical protein BZA77DRAFT_289895 [Pyronema omphalodes]|nr:hypothetical protein BZA77DRAFT_289895 [Pyronema omphalodes]
MERLLRLLFPVPTIAVTATCRSLLLHLSPLWGFRSIEGNGLRCNGQDIIILRTRPLSGVWIIIPSLFAIFIGILALYKMELWILDVFVKTLMLISIVFLAFGCGETEAHE